MQSIALICGGPSDERGISLNSTRCVFDHLDQSHYQITLLYVNPALQRYQIPHHLIYSNTPLDFDYYLQSHDTPLDNDAKLALLTQQDLVVPLIHGLYGEDGQLQAYLEDHDIPFVGSSSTACRNTSNKLLCQKILADAGYYSLSPIPYHRGDALPDLPEGKRVIKPRNGGSSLGVHFFSTTAELQALGDSVFAQQDECIIEPFCEGREFTLMVLDNIDHQPVALLPSEIAFGQDTFFDYRKKYLPTNHVRYHTPARFDSDTIAKIRHEAQQVFALFELKDGARLDGRVLDDGTIWRSDINAIMGMEQNSFLFQQTAILGLSHRQTIDYYMQQRLGLKTSYRDKTCIPVIFGGNTAERQVSVMSGSNVVMKLSHSMHYYPQATFLDRAGQLRSIPHYLCLLHTVEEIEEKIAHYSTHGILQTLDTDYIKPILSQLGLSSDDGQGLLWTPKQTSRAALAEQHDFVFLGLHGGAGENGEIQAKLDQLGLAYNGPSALSSKLCADKQASKNCVDAAQIPNVRTPRSLVITLDEYEQETRQQIQDHCNTTNLIVKPNDDGCSAGVIRINSQTELDQVIHAYRSGASHIPAGTINPHHGHIEMPTTTLKSVLIEEYIVTDTVTLQDLTIQRQTVSGYIEVTVGVVGTAGNMHALSPSQTVASSTVLSVEEKFMGGTGVNLTPPPTQFVPPAAITKCKQSIEAIAHALGISGYSRIDAFLHTQTGEVVFLEANTLPALTPSTVIFHQALAEQPRVFPGEFLESTILKDILDAGFARNT